jgi:hypothetical protein
VSGRAGVSAKVVGGVNAQLLTVLVTAVVSVATTLLAVFYGPAWKDRVDARRASRQRSEHLLARYSEPLARAAFDLQSRLYNIHRLGFLTASNIPEPYRRLSTLWFYGQFLAWVEIIRREVQVIDFGDVQRTAQLQRQLFDVVDIVASDSIPDAQFRVFRANQRAIGESMVTERTTGEHLRSDSLGYAEFVQRMEADPAFARWFDGLDRNITALVNGGSPGVRLVLTQRALIDLINFIDPNWIRFPDPNERGKLSPPSDVLDRKRTRPTTEVARFRYETDPLPTLAAWAHDNGLRTVGQDIPGRARVSLPRGLRLRRFDVVLGSSPPWVELHVVPRGQKVRSDRGRLTGRRPLALSPRQADVLNSLLRRFDRPTLPYRGRRPPK